MAQSVHPSGPSALDTPAADRFAAPTSSVPPLSSASPHNRFPSSPGAKPPSPHAPLSSSSSSSSPSSPRNTDPLPRPRTYPFYLGGVAACVAATVTHPLELAKNLQQTSKARPRGFAAALVETVARDGARALYTGLSASLLRQMTYSVTRFGTYDYLKARVASRSADDGGKATPLPGWKMAACASVAGAAGGLAGNPADIILVRMTSDLNKPPEKRYGYSNALSGVTRMLRTEGFSSLFRGLAPNVSRAVLMNASQLATYDYFKHWLLASPTLGFRDGLPLHFVASFLAGTVATTVCAPADVVKARVMSSGAAAAAAAGEFAAATPTGHVVARQTGMATATATPALVAHATHVGGGGGEGRVGTGAGQGAGGGGGGGGQAIRKLRHAIRTEGAGFLFRGWTPAWIRLSPNTILIFVTLEQLRLAVDKMRGDVGEAAAASTSRPATTSSSA